MTPEGRTKKRIKEILAARGSLLKAFWPVQNGLGAATLDCHVCYHGFYLIIEAKALGEAPTPRQESTIGEYEMAEAWILVIDGSDYTLLEYTLDQMRDRAHAPE